MLNINANGSGSDFDNGLAAGSNSAVNEFEKGVIEAFRAFLDEVRKLYGKEAIYYCNTNGTFDFGGGNFQINLSVTNYPDAETPAIAVSVPEVKEVKTGPQAVTPATAFSGIKTDGVKVNGDK